MTAIERELVADALAEADSCIFYCRDLPRLYVEEVIPVFDPTDRTNGTRNATCAELLGRMKGWLHTISQLHELHDIQVFAAAARSIAETTLDLVLIRQGKNDALTKMLTWEQSAKLKAALKQKEYAEQCGLEVLAAAQAFLDRHEKGVLALRKEIWGGLGHPHRWTGEKLDEDFKVGARLAPEFGFDEFHANSYLWVTFTTHGSGLVGVRGVPSDVAPSLAVKPLPYIASFATGAVRVGLRRGRSRLGCI